MSALVQCSRANNCCSTKSLLLWSIVQVSYQSACPKLVGVGNGGNRAPSEPRLLYCSDNQHCLFKIVALYQSKQHTIAPPLITDLDPPPKFQLPPIFFYLYKLPDMF
uniref:Uncharacterized protein n=1 Tax=Sphaerodactylus townsendi TaxID=933632 RepID=A0ACB8E744_9SAUR